MHLDLIFLHLIDKIPIFLTKFYVLRLKTYINI